MNNEKGITLIALIITAIIMSMLIGVGIYYGREAINTAKLEDKKTDMISIKTKAKILAEEYNFNEDVANKMGVKIENSFEQSKFGASGELYKWDRNTLDQQGLNLIEADVYYVKYDFDNPNNTEVYYIEGYNEKYSLTQLQDL